MNTSPWTVLLLLLAAVVISVPGHAQHSAGREATGADAVYRNGAIYTLDELRPWAEAIAVRDGRIVAVGNDAEVAARVGKGTRIVDLDGRFVLPGFRDSHVHPILGGLKTRGLFVHPDLDAEAAAAVIGDYARAHPGQRIIVARGFGSQLKPHRSVLDRQVPDRPVFVEGFSGHSLWLNSAALALAGIDRNTATPAGGAIIRDEPDGEPTGLLVDTAAYLAQAVMPDARPTLAEKVAVGRRVLAEMSRYGITAFKDAIVDEDVLAVYRTLEREGALHQRVAAAILVSGFGLTPEQEAEARRLVERRGQYRSRLIDPDFVKLFLDGVPPAMALIDPPPTIPDPMTEPLIRGAELQRTLAAYDAQGIGVMAHAHGDAAIRAFLDALAGVRRDRPGPGPAHQVAHCSTIRAADAERLRELGAVCEMSPYIWFPSPLMQAASGVLGHDLTLRAYPAGTVTAAGGPLAAGSDWAYDNLDLNPLPYLEALVSRRDPLDRTEGVLNPDQALSVAQAIRTFTLNGALAMGAADVGGSIEPGKQADVVVLDRNLFSVPVDDISEARVEFTVFDGRIVYQRSTEDGAMIPPLSSEHPANALPSSHP